MSVAASAPGKLFLLGEYAVLDGSPALLAAVSARARVNIKRRDDRHWSVVSRQAMTSRVDYIPGASSGLPLLDIVLGALNGPVDPCDIELDSTPFFSAATGR